MESLFFSFAIYVVVYYTAQTVLQGKGRGESYMSSLSRPREREAVWMAARGVLVRDGDDVTRVNDYTMLCAPAAAAVAVGCPLNEGTNRGPLGGLFGSLRRPDRRAMFALL